MDKKKVVEALKKAKEQGNKRNFKQSVDLIINLKGIDVKKSEQQVEFFAQIHHSLGRKVKVCALVGRETEQEAKSTCDTTIVDDEFEKYAKDKKLLKKLAKTHDVFIAQANIMPKVATSLGKVLGPKGKMPNPKAGNVFPPKSNLKPLYEKLQNTIKVKAKTEPCVKCVIGNEEMNEEEVADNAVDIYNQLLTHLSNEKDNIKNVMIKLTMGKPVKVE